MDKKIIIYLILKIIVIFIFLLNAKIEHFAVFQSTDSATVTGQLMVNTNIATPVIQNLASIDANLTIQSTAKVVITSTTGTVIGTNAANGNLTVMGKLSCGTIADLEARILDIERRIRGINDDTNYGQELGVTIKGDLILRSPQIYANGTPDVTAMRFRPRDGATLIMPTVVGRNWLNSFISISGDDTATNITGITNATINGEVTIGGNANINGELFIKRYLYIKNYGTEDIKWAIGSMRGSNNLVFISKDAQDVFDWDSFISMIPHGDIWINNATINGAANIGGYATVGGEVIIKNAPGTTGAGSYTLRAAEGLLYIGKRDANNNWVKYMTINTNLDIINLGSLTCNGLTCTSLTCGNANINGNLTLRQYLCMKNVQTDDVKWIIGSMSGSNNLVFVSKNAQNQDNWSSYISMKPNGDIQVNNLTATNLTATNSASLAYTRITNDVIIRNGNTSGWGWRLRAADGTFYIMPANDDDSWQDAYAYITRKLGMHLNTLRLANRHDEQDVFTAQGTVAGWYFYINKHGDTGWSGCCSYWPP